MKALILALASGAAAWAQCSMCRTAVTGATGKTLDTAVLILLFPAMALFCGVYLTAFRAARSRSGPEDDERRDG